MSIEERLEALSQLVELMAGRQRDQLARNEETDRRIKELVGAVTQDADNIRALARIAEMHERRLTRLEGDAPL